MRLAPWRGPRERATWPWRGVRELGALGAWGGGETLLAVRGQRLGAAPGTVGPLCLACNRAGALWGASRAPLAGGPRKRGWGGQVGEGSGRRQGGRRRSRTPGGAGVSVPRERVNKCGVYRAPTGARTCDRRGPAARVAPLPVRLAWGEDPALQMIGEG